MSVADKKNTAVVLEVGDRFFRGFGKDGRIKTAWSLAGSLLFGCWREEEIIAAERRLEAKGKRSKRGFIFLETEPGNAAAQSRE